VTCAYTSAVVLIVECPSSRETTINTVYGHAIPLVETSA
jgi:hypothetical protein